MPITSMAPGAEVGGAGASGLARRSWLFVRTPDYKVRSRSVVTDPRRAYFQLYSAETGAPPLDPPIGRRHKSRHAPAGRPFCTEPHRAPARRERARRAV